MMINDESPAKFLPDDDLQSLIDVLLELGYDVIGPTVEQQAIVYRSIQNVNALPQGWSDYQEPAVYRIEHGDSKRRFGFNSGPDSWKRFLFPSSLEIGKATLSQSGWRFESAEQKSPRYALLGVRNCDLAAIAVQDRVFLENPYLDVAYKRRRDAAFIVAVNCSTAASTCFCTSMGHGPECESGYSLVMTEIDGGYVIRSGSHRGDEVLSRLHVTSASDEQLEATFQATDRARQQITRHLETEGLHDRLLERLEHPHWDKVAGRCLSCTNCTMVCPTCFCSSVSEASNLSGTEVTRIRTWDSCFNVDLTYTAGGTVRADVRSRYRQWLTHKLATWEDQYGVSGCVGCGRCITWCPVGIDLTAEVAAIVDNDWTSE